MVEGSINVPSTEKLIFSSSVCLCLEFVPLKINDSHFPGFSRRPLSVIQLEITANSEFRVFCTILAFAFNSITMSTRQVVRLKRKAENDGNTDLGNLTVVPDSKLERLFS